MEYTHPLPHYAERYDRSLSSIKRYARQEAPLDDPQQMQYFLALKKDTGRTGKRADIQAPTARRVPSAALEILRTMCSLIDQLHDLNDDLGKVEEAPPWMRGQAESFGHTISDFDTAFFHRFVDEDDEELTDAVCRTDPA